MKRNLWSSVGRENSQDLTYKIIPYFIVKAMVDIIGQNATKVILRKIDMFNLLELRETPSLDETIPLENLLRLMEINMKIFGESYAVFSRKAGYDAAREVKFPDTIMNIIEDSSKFADWRRSMKKISERLLAPFGSRVEQNLLDDGYVTKIYKCPECRGLKTNKPCCYFLSSFISGIIKRLFNIEVNVNEVRCIALGEEFCEFRVILKR